MQIRPRIMPWLLLTTSCSPTEFAWRQSRVEDIARYRQSFVTAVGAMFDAVCSRSELLASLDHSQVLWLGDHHRSRDLHRLQRALLRQLAAQPRQVVLVLEALGQQDQGHIDAFCKGRMELLELRRALLQRWSGSWLDDRELDADHYRQLCTLARQHQWPLLALEPTPRRNLDDRDAAMVARVAAIAAQHAPALVVVLVGQAHLCGEGDVVRRTGLPAVVLGGEPPEPLASCPPPPSARPLPRHYRSSGGLWWFDEVCAPPAR